MSEQIPESTPATGDEAKQTDPTSDKQTEPRSTETVEHWREMAKLQEKRAKENAQKAKEFDAFQESQKSEQQKIADRAAAAERERDEARSDGLRYKAAAKHGINEDYFDLLGSGSEEEIASRAERVGGLLKVQAENEQLKAELEALKQGKTAPPNHRPTAALKPGATAEQIPAAEDDSYPSHWLP